MENNNLEQRVVALETKIKKVENDLVVIFGQNKNNSSEDIAKKMSIKEFIMTKKIDDDVKRTLAVGYFLEHMESVSAFNVDDMKKFFRLAKLKLPSNINDKINMNIKNGHIMEAVEKKDSKKAWVLTGTGEIYVEANFKV